MATVNLITAVMGAGKTLYSIKLIDDLLQPTYDDNGQLLPLPQIYTNIDGLQVDKFLAPNNIHLFDLPADTPDNKVFDWRDCPTGSVVIYDEAQFFFPRHMTDDGGARNQTPKILLDMTMARHMGITIWLITQDASQVHVQIRNVTGMHKHLYRAATADISTIYTWHHYVDNPNSRHDQARAMAELWSYPKRYYGYYKSAEIHTGKWSMPAKLKWLLLGIVLTLGWSIYALVRDGGFALARDATTDVTQALADTTPTHALDAASATIAPSAPESPTGSSAPADPVAHQAHDVPMHQSSYAWSAQPEATPVMGCVWSVKRRQCQCFSVRGVTLDLEPAACISAAVAQPYPRKLNVQSSSSASDIGAGQ